jgi:hypothetical protein
MTYNIDTITNHDLYRHKPYKNIPFSQGILPKN